MLGEHTSTKLAFFYGVLSPLAIATAKLVGASNYVSSLRAIEVWCMGQGLKDHLTTKSENIEKDKDAWLKADALSCSLL